MSIEALRIVKRFGPFTALQDVSLHVKRGELVALIGPSGSGKTTLLRIIAGLEVPDSGVILIDDEDTTYRQVRQRRVGFVFQHYALFRHMTVFDNIAFGLNVRPRKLRPSQEEIQSRVHDLLRLVQLEGLAQRYPSQLSGGQRQRIALARALAVEPTVMLLDEPFGALDAKVRKDLRRWLRRLHDEIHITSIFVTHDQEEALEVADRVVVMHQGKIEQAGTPEEVYDNPASPFVYDFLGNVNLFRGRIHQGQARIGQLVVEVPEHADKQDIPAVGYARPHDMEVSRSSNQPDAIQAVITAVTAIGPIVRLDLQRYDNGERLEVELIKERFRELKLQQGDSVFVRPQNLKVFVAS
jgi:sulfate transport system ATP-binding protein